MVIFGVVLRAATKQPRAPQGNVSRRTVPPQGAADPIDTRATSDTVAPTRPADRSRATKRSLPSARSYQTQRSGLRPRALLLMGVTCVIFGVALYAANTLAVPPQNAADPTDKTTMSGVDASTPPNTTSPGATPAVTLTTIEPAALPGRLAQIAATVGFTILGLKAPSWELAAVDTQTQAGESFAAVNYVRGADYVTITQQKTATPPTLLGAQPTTIRGQAGTLALMNPVVLLRWQEQGVAILLSTNLPRDAALSLTDRLEPVP